MAHVRAALTPLGAILLLSCGGLVACKGEPEATGPTPMPAPQLLARLSLDLRGRRPTEDEIAAVEADETKLDDFVENYLQDPGFGEQVFSWYADVYKTRADKFIVGVDGDGTFMDQGYKARFTHAVGDEPLRILQRVADDGLPWTEVVTADWTMANDALLSAWPLEALEEGEGWRKARYTDSRPGAGVLTTNGLWWRYTSTAENVNRSRAEAVARLTVCDARFDQPVEFSSVASSLDELQDRAQTDPGCVSCHVVLDPIGSYFFGFWRMHPESYSEAAWYYPNRELYWQDITGIDPGWYGAPGGDLYDLGDQIAGDSRFVDCAVKQGYQFLFGEAPTALDTDRLTGFREAFIQGDLALRSLYRALSADPWYRSNDPDEDGTLAVRRLSPSQLSSAVEALTGFRWTYEELDMLANDTWGVRVLAGGMDGIIVTQAATDHSTSEQLVVERLAQAASTTAVDREAALSSGERILFREVEDLGATPTTDALEAQIIALVLRVHSRRLAADDEEIQALVELYGALEAETGAPDQAWALLLSALLRHPDFLQY